MIRLGMSSEGSEPGFLNKFVRRPRFVEGSEIKLHVPPAVPPFRAVSIFKFLHVYWVYTYTGVAFKSRKSPDSIYKG